MEQRRVGNQWYAQVRIIDLATALVEEQILFGGKLFDSPELALQETLLWLGPK